MLNTRFEYFRNLSKEEKEKLEVTDFLNSELEELINETALNEEDNLIAKYRYINQMSYELIAEKIGIDIKTCYRRIEKISIKLKKTIIKYFL